MGDKVPVDPGRWGCHKSTIRFWYSFIVFPQICSPQHFHSIIFLVAWWKYYKHLLNIDTKGSSCPRYSESQETRVKFSFPFFEWFLPRGKVKLTYCDLILLIFLTKDVFFRHNLFGGFHNMDFKWAFLSLTVTLQKEMQSWLFWMDFSNVHIALSNGCHITKPY